MRKYVWGKYGAVWIFLLQFVVALIAMVVWGRAADQSWNEIIAEFWSNIQSEAFQAALICIVTIFAIAQGSAQSRDSDDRLEEKVDALDRKIDGLTGMTGELQSPIHSRLNEIGFEIAELRRGIDSRRDTP